MNDLSDKVLSELRSKDVRPVPAWRFVLNAVLVWVGVAVFVLLGAQSVSVIIFLLSDHDWRNLSYFRGGPFGYALTVVPYVWLAALVALIAVAFLEFRRTKTGYRYRPVAVISSVAAISLAAGIALHFAGAGRAADEMLEGGLPQYRMMVPLGIQIWDNPEAGRLVGEVRNLRQDGSFDLVAPDGEAWFVHVGPEPRGAFRGELPLKEGMTVRVVGQPRDSGSFEAEAVLPWRPGIRPRSGKRPPGGNRVTEENSDGMRNTGEGRMRPSVHPARPLEP